MKCEYCGRTLQEEEYSCPGCGAPVEHPQGESHKHINSGKRTKIEVKVGDVNISIDGTTGENQQPVSPLYKKDNDSQQMKMSSEKLNLHFDSEELTRAARGKIKYGGFITRVMAVWLDWIICSIIIMGILIAIDGNFSFGIFSLVWAVYDIVCLTYFDGATPGKKGMRIKVVNKDYGKVNLVQAVIRTAAKIIPWSVCIGYLMIPFSNKKRGLHDCIAGTYVIRD